MHSGTYDAAVSRNRRLLARALTMLMFLGLLVGVAPARAADPLRVLLTGDSITQGFHGDYTWRYRLYKEFVRQGVAVDFVGSRNLPIVKAGYLSAHYIDPNFDRDHFAQGGSSLGSHRNWIAAEVRAQQPDVIVLGAGINDLRNSSTPERVDEYLQDWINAARSEKPNVRLVISPVLDAIDPAREWLADRAHQYNELAEATVAEMSTEESPITMADTTNGWSVTAHTAENLHPNPTGETLIAQRIGETFRAMNVLPQQPNLYRWTSWNRQPRVKVAFKGQQAVLSWDNQAITGARIWIRRGGYSPYFPATVYGGYSMTTSSLVPRATYEFRVAFVRGRTQTPVGPGTTVVAPVPPPPAAVSQVVINSAGIRWTRSARATSYLVKFRRNKPKRWISRTTTGLYLTAARVKRAQVWAVNAGGRSPMRAAVR